MARFRRRRRFAELRRQPERCPPSYRPLCRPHPQRRQSRRSAGLGADQVRVRAQPQDRQDTRPRNTREPTRLCRRGDRMKRREFIALLGGTAATWPLAARAQQPTGRVYRVGYMSIASREQTLHFIDAFEERLRSLGYRVGENVVIEYRFADGEMERLPSLAADLVRLGVDIIVATGTNPTTVAAMKATTTIPIVMTSVDPVGTGLVASLARPGGNVTGLTPDTGGEILGKRFELLKETLPNLSRLGILFNPDVAFTRTRQTSMSETARTLGLTTIPVEARGMDALEQAFATMVRERAQVFVMQGDSVLYGYR